jgi:hypothetical protein
MWAIFRGYLGKKLIEIPIAISGAFMSRAAFGTAVKRLAVGGLAATEAIDLARAVWQHYGASSAGSPAPIQPATDVAKAKYIAALKSEGIDPAQPIAPEQFDAFLRAVAKSLGNDAADYFRTEIERYKAAHPNAPLPAQEPAGTTAPAPPQALQPVPPPQITPAQAAAEMSRDPQAPAEKRVRLGSIIVTGSPPDTAAQDRMQQLIHAIERLAAALACSFDRALAVMDALLELGQDLAITRQEVATLKTLSRAVS